MDCMLLPLELPFTNGVVEGGNPAGADLPNILMLLNKSWECRRSAPSNVHNGQSGRIAPPSNAGNPDVLDEQTRHLAVF